jgi:hypothetical protein
MVIVTDIRSITPRSNKTRNVESITHIARHHSGGETGDFKTFWKHWNGTKGWGTGGYHEIILRDGTVQLCYDPEEITNGVANHNLTTYHICVVGNGSFTDAQERAWENRALYNLKRFKLSADKVLGHKEFKGAATACPGISMGVVRNRLIYLQLKAAEALKAATAKKTIYRVITGSFADKDNAEARMKELKKAGFESFIDLK